MKNNFLLILVLLLITSCYQKNNKKRAIKLIQSTQKNSNEKFDFENSKLDSLFNISPEAYMDSLKRGDDLDSVLAVLENQIEHLDKKQSDSLGLISKTITNQRYQLLEFKKNRPQFIGWKLSDIKIKGDSSKILSFNFDKELSKIIP